MPRKENKMQEPGVKVILDTALDAHAMFITVGASPMVLARHDDSPFQTGDGGDRFVATDIKPVDADKLTGLLNAIAVSEHQQELEEVGYTSFIFSYHDTDRLLVEVFKKDAVTMMVLIPILSNKTVRKGLVNTAKEALAKNLESLDNMQVLSDDLRVLCVFNQSCLEKQRNSENSDAVQ